MTELIPPRRDEILSEKGIGERRFLKYLEENAEQTNSSTELTEADPSSVNLSNAQISQINKKIAEIVSENLTSQNAIVSKLNKRIEQLETVIIINQNSKTDKKVSNLENDFIAPFYKTAYEKLKIKLAEIANATISEKLKLPLTNDATDPTVQFTGNDGYYQESSGVLVTSIAGVKRYAYSSTTFTTPNGSWGASGIDLLTSDEYKINGVTKLTETGLGSTVVSSNLSSVGTLTTVNTSGDYNVDGVRVVSNRGAGVTDASGGATIDAEARTAINDLLARVRVHGLIA